MEPLPVDDLAERLAALQARNAEPLPPPDPPATWDWTEDEIKAAYLELLAQGYQPPQAARHLGKTGRYMRSFRSEKSARYDPAFAERYEEVMREGGEHHASVVENLHGWLLEQAEAGNMRAIEKALMRWDPGFAFLKPAAFTGDVNIDKLMVVVRELETPELETLHSALLAAKQKALPDIEVA